MRSAILFQKSVLSRAYGMTRFAPTATAVTVRPPAPRPTRTDSFSSSAATAPSPPRRRRIVEDKDPIVVTPRAQDRLQELLKNKPDAIGIRLGVRRRGCNGLSYTLNYAEQGDDHSKNISLQTEKGIKVWIEPMALFSIVGTTMDWEETELSSEFTFNNPNSKGSCGCGESFNV
ncbi:hypothetical protein MPSEU_000603600 [Mayamaea pseudoterrestris]|nr:hypothetical protein MPSEU_000603600 [Mayamaea pseudoterrestris]